MKRLCLALIVFLMLSPFSGCQANERTAITDSLSLTLPGDIIAFTAEEAEKDKQLCAILHAVTDSAETLYIGALPARESAALQYSVVYIIQREKEAAAATGTANIGTYADTNAFALGLAAWYKNAFPDFYVVDALSGQDGAPVFVVHVATEDGIALLGETYSTDYSDSIIACFFDESGSAAEPTQAQYDAFIALLKTIAVK